MSTTNDQSRKDRLEAIANLVMHALISKELLEKFSAQASDCDGSVECLVNQHMDFDKADFQALSEALSFTSLAQYEQAHTRLDARGMDGKWRDKAAEELSHGKLSGDWSNTVAAIAEPFNALTQRRKIADLGCTYAILSGQLERLGFFFSGLKGADNIKPGSILDNYRSKALILLEDMGLKPERDMIITERRPENSGPPESAPA